MSLTDVFIHSIEHTSPRSAFRRRWSFAWHIPMLALPHPMHERRCNYLIRPFLLPRLVARCLAHRHGSIFIRRATRLLPLVVSSASSTRFDDDAPRLYSLHARS